MENLLKSPNLIQRAYWLIKLPALAPPKAVRCVPDQVEVEIPRKVLRFRADVWFAGNGKPAEPGGAQRSASLPPDAWPPFPAGAFSGQFVPGITMD